jgi:hypothetical protein
MKVTNECIYKRRTKVKYFYALKENSFVIKLSISTFFVAKFCQNVKKKEKRKRIGERPFGTNWIKKKSPYFDLTKAHDAIHAMHGMDPSLFVLQGTHLLPHFLKHQPVVIISSLLLLDVTNFITM